MQDADAGAKTDTGSIAEEPVSILFNQSMRQKTDVWEIDIVRILEMLVKILERSGNKDLRIAGTAALTSSVIYRMKVESIFAPPRSTTKKQALQRRDVEIPLIGIPYRHTSTYPVTLEDLLDLLNNLIGSMANPGRNRKKSILESTMVADVEEHLVNLADVIGKYKNLILKKIDGAKTVLFEDIVRDLDPLDAVRCFFAVLFMTTSDQLRIRQDGDDILISAGVNPD